MKSSKSPVRSPLLKMFLSMVAVSLIGCAFQKSYMESREKLSRNIKVFNAEFESKSIDVSPLMVRADKREEFLMKVPQIKEKATFDEISIVNAEYFKDGSPVKQSGGAPTQDFDEAVMTLRYRMAVLPSNKLETRVVKQKWVLEGDDWVVVPDLDAFLK